MNHKPALPSFYHPTTVLFVDDDPDAVRNFHLLLPSCFSAKTFTHPQEALDYLNSPERIPPLHKRCRPLITEIDFFEKEFGYPRRFEQCCMVVTDYAMPGMNGLDFCRNIENPHIQKILLTGIGDEKLAVEAFNEGVIHRFFVKQDPDIFSKLIAALTQIQHDFFCDISYQVNQLMTYGHPTLSCLEDPVFIRFFEEQLKCRSIGEYYLSTHPGGFALVNEKGDISRWVVATNEEIDRYEFMIANRHTPGRFENLADPNNPLPHRNVPYFWQNENALCDRGFTSWEDFRRTAETLIGNKKYYYAFIEKPAVYSALMDDFVSYSDYLESLDTEEPAPSF